ncbi:GNAT family N-acetyltransferase [Actinophytocola sp.]|uniref:GNAT family N-acetyltransferase n=1 Tax=Actinophytocola sp. TaxID=1872138 RepID=UPI002EDAD97F
MTGEPATDLADAYLDAAPRADADAVEVGPFTLFVSRTPWSYYARPARGRHDPIGGADLRALDRACAEHGVELSVEWVSEVRPELARVAAEYGLEVSTHALMVAEPHRVHAPDVDGVRVRVVPAGDPALRAARAVADVSFGFGGTHPGTPGAADRDAVAATLSPDLVDHLDDRARRGLTVTAVAETEDGVVAAGSYQPVDGAAEVLAVATLPSARRRGLAGLVTALLARHAGEQGVRTVLLSAQDDEVARVYGRVGFTRVGTAAAAEPPQD